MSEKPSTYSRNDVYQLQSTTAFFVSSIAPPSTSPVSLHPISTSDALYAFFSSRIASYKMFIHCSQQCEILTCSACRELQALQGEVDVAEVALRNTKRRRATQLQRMNARKAAATRLPTEIVRYIIELFINCNLQEQEMDASEYAPYPVHDKPRLFRAVHRSVPLLLGAISHQWRAVSWSFPELWSMIVIPLSCPWNEHGPQMVSEWLQRSGKLPLSVQINDSDPSKFSGRRDEQEKAQIHENAKAIIQVLNRYASRWETLDFSDTHLSLLDHLDGSGCTNESVLRQLCLGGLLDDFRYFVENPEAQPVLFRSKRTHRPTHLNLLFHINPAKINIDWSALTHLFLEGMARDLLFQLLEHTAAHLTHLSIRAINGWDLGDVEWRPNTPLTIPNLVSLSVNEYGAESSNTAILFQSLTTPRLHTLSYDGADSGFIFPFFQFLELTDRSPCQLKNLDLQRHSLPDADLETLLVCIRSLTSLKLRLSQGQDCASFLECLSAKELEIDDDDSPFLPSLRRLDITAYMRKDYWWNLIAIYGKPSTFGMHGTSLLGHTTVPARRDLKIKFNVRYRSRHGYHGFRDVDSLMDRSSVSSLVWLWKTFGVTCVFQFESDNSGCCSVDPGCFLERSHQSGRRWGDPRLMSEAEVKYRELWDDVVAMTKLRF